MGRVVTLGADRELHGFALAGAEVVPASSDDDIVAAWRALDDDVALVVMTATAADLLEPELADRPDVLTAVLP